MSGREWSLSERRTYRVKEVPKWHGQQDTPRFATTSATTARERATAPPSTPAITSARRTPHGDPVAGDRTPRSSAHPVAPTSEVGR